MTFLNCSSDSKGISFKGLFHWKLKVGKETEFLILDFPKHSLSFEPCELGHYPAAMKA